MPDSVARVSLLPFEQMPAKAADLDQLIRWQLRRRRRSRSTKRRSALRARTYRRAATTLAAVVARRDVIAQYEAVAGAAGIHAGLVDLASFNVMNAVMGAGAAPPGDWLLVHARAPEATTLAIMRGQRPDVLPAPRGGGRRAAERAGAPDGDVSRGPARRHAVRARVALRRRRSAGQRRGQRAARSATGWACRPRPSTSGRPRRCATGSTRPLDVLDALAAPVGRAAARTEGGLSVMLRGNLSTRPFYNERLVTLVLLLVALVASR